VPHELCIVKGKRRRRGSAVICVNFGNGFGRRCPVVVEQFLGLPFQLIEIGGLAQSAKAVCEPYELLSWPRVLRACRGCPPSAATGKKGVHVTTAVTSMFGVDAVLPADVGGAPSAIVSIPKCRPLGRTLS
jgi:hypothetical protein